MSRVEAVVDDVAVHYLCDCDAFVELSDVVVAQVVLHVLVELVAGRRALGDV